MGWGLNWSLGRGLGFGLKKFSVVPLESRNICLEVESGREKRLRLISLDLPEPLVGALAVEITQGTNY